MFFGENVSVVDTLLYFYSSRSIVAESVERLIIFNNRSEDNKCLPYFYIDASGLVGFNTVSSEKS